MQNNKNLLIATALSMMILLGWTWFYEKPRMERKEAEILALTTQTKAAQTNLATRSESSTTNTPGSIQAAPKTQEMGEIFATKSREEVLTQDRKDRVTIISNNLHGSLSLKGLRFDDLTLAQYFTDTSKKSEVALLSPAESNERYFADFGWISSDKSLDLPSPNTIWKSDSKKLTPTSPVNFSWRNKQNVEFKVEVSLDENYMFDVTQSISNNSGQEIAVASYGRINRILNQPNQSNYILQEGPIGVFSDVVHETTYKDIMEEKRQSFENTHGGWLGITDKYWLSSLIPDQSLNYSATFSSDIINKNRVFSTEFIGQEYRIAPSETVDFNHHFFAGAKKVKLLEQYSKTYGIKFFDRAIDFGWFYFLTKPFFYIIDFLYKFLGNFGLAILAMTVLVKLALFPMANKSYLAIGKMKKLQPKIVSLREKHKGDKMAINREMMELYKKEKVNPAAGCLPVLIQIPVFFALYKVLFVTLDMRHASFYGWIHDLSAPDPTSIFNLFGLLPFNVSSTFTIGIWPILMGLTMILQQKMSPATTDPTQAKVLKYMPYVLTFVLATFPAGLVIYWTWSNVLSILQQWVITRKLNK